jgi:hypothetical protein
MILPLVHGSTVSHHFEQPDMGVLGFTIISIVPAFIAFLTFACAGIGILKRKPWGFYCHLAGSGMAALTIILAPYTIISFIISFKPYFKGQFFPELAD